MSVSENISDACLHVETTDKSYVSGVKRFTSTRCVRCGYDVKSSVGPAYSPITMRKTILDRLVKAAKEIGHDTVHGFVLDDGTHLPCNFGSHGRLMSEGFKGHRTVLGDVDWLCYRYNMVKVTGDGDILIFGGRDGMPSRRQIAAMRRLIAKSGVADHWVILDLHVGSAENDSRLRRYLGLELHIRRAAD